MKKALTILMSSLMAISCGNNQPAQETQTAVDQQPQTEQTQQVVYANNYLVKVGDIAPDFSLPLTDGTTFKLSEQRGKVQGSGLRRPAGRQVHHPSW